MKAMSITCQKGRCLFKRYSSIDHLPTADNKDSTEQWRQLTYHEQTEEQ